MIPQRFPQSNIVMTKPEGWTEEQCADVHAFKGDDTAGNRVCITAWKPTPDELVRLNLGEPLFLTIHADGMPPVALHVQSPFA